MSLRIDKIALAVVLLFLSAQVAEAQYRGRGGSSGSSGRSYGGDRDGNGRSSEEMRRRFEEMRSRYGGGDRGSSSGYDRSRFSSSGDRSRFSGFDRSRFSSSSSSRDRGGFSGFDRSRFGSSSGFDRSRFGSSSGFDRSRGGFSGFDRGRDGGDDDRSRWDRSRGGDDRSRGDGRGGDAKPAAFVPKDRVPIGVTLPDQYIEGDGDGDGQIALFEWRQWKPQEVNNFMMMDVNKDGFLTARELIIAQNSSEQMAVATPSSDSSSPSPTPTPSDSQTDADGNNSGEKASAPEARYVFRALDKDRDGKISSDEWSQSKSVRAAFEKTGITLPFPVDEPTFMDRYPPYRIVPQLRLPG